MTTGTLIIFSGLPGSGKSTLAGQLASKLQATYIRIDTIEQGLRGICGISEIDGSGYELAHRIASENLRLGNLVIADSVNPWELTRKAWNDVAQELGARFFDIEVICSNQDEHRKRVETRKPTVAGLKMPTWQEVLQRDYQAWTTDRCVIDTAGRTEAECLDDLIVALGSAGIALPVGTGSPDHIRKSHLILYVADQSKSTAFYRAILDTKPTLNVPGMTEFPLPNGTILGLMPEAGIKRLLGNAIADPANANGIPRAELYLQVSDPALYLRRANELGARELSPLMPRDWGDTAGYCADLDGHVLAFAHRTEETV